MFPICSKPTTNDLYYKASVSEINLGNSQLHIAFVEISTAVPYCLINTKLLLNSFKHFIANTFTLVEYPLKYNTTEAFEFHFIHKYRTIFNFLSYVVLRKGVLISETICGRRIYMGCVRERFVPLPSNYINKDNWL